MPLNMANQQLKILRHRVNASPKETKPALPTSPLTLVYGGIKLAEELVLSNPLPRGNFLNSESLIPGISLMSSFLQALLSSDLEIIELVGLKSQIVE